jgi:hypothetical protein
VCAIRYYEEPFPEVEDIVMVTVKHIADMAAEVTLLEYNNIEVRRFGGGDDHNEDGGEEEMLIRQRLATIEDIHHLVHSSPKRMTPGRALGPEQREDSPKRGKPTSLDV